MRKYSLLSTTNQKHERKQLTYPSMARRAEPTAVDTLSEAFKLPLVFIMRSAYVGQSPDAQDKVIQVGS